MSKTQEPSVYEQSPAARDGRLKNVTPLPHDPNQRLTQEQLDALFPPQNRETGIRELVRLTRKHRQERARRIAEVLEQKGYRIEPGIVGGCECPLVIQRNGK